MPTIRKLLCRLFGHRFQITEKEYIPTQVGFGLEPTTTIEHTTTIEPTTSILERKYVCTRCGKVKPDPLAGLIARVHASGDSDITDLR